MISPMPSKRSIVTSARDNIRIAMENKSKPNAPINTDDAWLEFFSDVYFGIKYTQTSGTSAQRPTTDLFPGRFYFDTSLGANGKPIYIGKDGATWILADGTAA